jgi:hypothetical protein
VDSKHHRLDVVDNRRSWLQTVRRTGPRAGLGAAQHLYAGQRGSLQRCAAGFPTRPWLEGKAPAVAVAPTRGKLRALAYSTPGAPANACSNRGL